MIRKFCSIVILLFSSLLPAQNTLQLSYSMQFNYNNFQSAKNRDHKCQLYINDEEALFVYKNAISLSDDPNSKLMTTMVYLDVFEGKSMLDYLKLAEGGFRVYTKQDSFINLEVVDSTNYILKEKINIHDWEYLDSTKVILNETCFLAKKHHRGRTYFAWFNPSADKILHKGPWKLQGLPGLVMEANSSDGCIKFVIDSATPQLSEFSIERPSDGIEITFEEYWSYYMKYRKTEFDRAHNGIIITLMEAGLDPESYNFPIFHNSMELLNNDLSKFEEWSVIKY